MVQVSYIQLGVRLIDHTSTYTSVCNLYIHVHAYSMVTSTLTTCTCIHMYICVAGYTVTLVLGKMEQHV